MKRHEVVISGISGRFPQCDTFEEFKDAIYRGEPLVQDNPKGWRDATAENRWMGAMKEPLRFDSSFFGVPRKVCEVMDLSTRLYLERVFECLVDAGLSPSEVRGSETAVCMCNVMYEWELQNLTEKSHSHVMMARARCMHANRISYAFDFTGPSMEMSATPVAGVQGLEAMSELVRSGRVPKAIVGVSNVAYTSYGSYHLDDHGLRLLTHDAETRSFSADADGYWRSEGVVVLLLERASEARRAYCYVEAAMAEASLDSFGHRFLSHPPEAAADFLCRFYNDNQFFEDEHGVALVIAEGSALPTVDRVELTALAAAVRGRQDEYLDVTSVKGIVGHGEACAPFFSLLAALATFQTGRIPPVRFFVQPEDAPWTDALNIVSEISSFSGDRIAVNSVGWINHWGHVVLRRPDCVSIPRSLSKDDHTLEIPKMVVLSGRDGNTMKAVLEKIRDDCKDPNYVGLLHKAFSKDIQRHIFRGYAILEKDHPVVTETYDEPEKRPVWLVLSGMGSQWTGMGAALMQIPVAAATLRRCAAALEPVGIDLINVLTSSDPSVCADIIHAFVGISAIQVALVDVLVSVGVEVDGIVGHSTGELACGYADGCLTPEQTVLSAFGRGRASLDSHPPKGMMAAIGMGYEEIKDKLPEGIEVACHNSSTSCTLSGPADIMEEYVSKLKADGVFAKLVNVSNIAYHTRYIAPAGPLLLKYLQQILPEPKERSSRWISSSIPEARWNEPLAKKCSPEYQTNNLLSPVYFEEAIRHVPTNAVLIEVAPHGLLQAILRRALPKCKHIPLTNRTAPDHILFLLEALGKAYVNGINIDLSRLYSPVQFPVPLNTKSLQDVVSWNHSDKWSFVFYLPEKTFTPDENSLGSLTYNPEEREIVNISKEYIIHNSSIIPDSRILTDVIKIFAASKKCNLKTMKVLIEDLKLENNLYFSDRVLCCQLSLMVSGHFNVSCSNKTIMQGKIIELCDSSHYLGLPTIELDGEKVELDSDDVYDFFKENGHLFDGPYNSIHAMSITDKGFVSSLKPLNKLEFFLESVFSSIVFWSMYNNSRPTKLTKIGAMAININELREQRDISFSYDSVRREGRSNEILIQNIVTTKLQNYSEEISLTKREFIPYGTTSNFQNEEEFYQACFQCILENSPELRSSSNSITSISVVESKTESQRLDSLLAQLCHVQCKDMSLHELLAESLSEGGTYLVSYKGKEVPFQVQSLLTHKSAYVLLHLPGVASTVNGLSTVYCHTTNDSTILLLRNKVNVNLSKPPVIFTSSLDWDKMSEEIENTLQSTTSNELLYLVFDNQPLDEFYRFSGMLTQSANVRFVFIHQGSQLTRPVFKSILESGLRVTIVKNSVHGSYCFLPIECTPQPLQQELSFSNQDSLSVHAVHIGSDFYEENSQEEIVEYSGYNHQSRVMGLASVMSNQFLPDSHLQWKIPPGWTIDQAATVPLDYCLAVYAVQRLGKACVGEIVFVTEPLSALGQAVVTIACSVGCRIMAAISSSDGRTQFLKNFPQVSDGDLVECTKDVLEITSGRGVDIAVVTSGPVQDVLDILTERAPRGFGGRLVLIDPSPMKHNHAFGMEVFIRKAGVVGLPPESLLHLAEKEKIWLYNCVNEATSHGIIRPPFSLPLTSPVKNSSRTLKCSSSLSARKKIIFPKKGEGETYNDRKKTSVIVGNYRGLWFNIMCNQAAKGNKCFHLLVDQDLATPFLLGRLKNFMVCYPHTSVHFYPTKSLQSRKELDVLIEDLQAYVFDTVIYITSESDDCSYGLAELLKSRRKEAFIMVVGMDAYSVKEMLDCSGVALLTEPHSTKLSIASAVDKCKSLPSVTALCKLKTGKLEKVGGGLPVDASSLRELDIVTSTEVELVPLLTRGAATIADAMPIIVLPGLKVASIISLARCLLYPAWLVKFPANVSSIVTLADDIAKLILKQCLELKVATLLCEGWSGGLALWVARKLELCGLQVLILAIEAAPAIVTPSFQNITPLRLLCKYFPLNKQKFDEISQKQRWEDQLDSAAESSPPELVTCAKSLATRLVLSSQFCHNDFTLDAKVILIRPTSTDKFDLCGLDMVCKRPVKLRQVPDGELFGSACVKVLQPYILYQIDDVRGGQRDLESMTAYINLDQLLSNLDHSVAQNHS